MRTRTAVLIHGCHLQAELNGQRWESIVWGFDADGYPTLTGRATMGIKAAIDHGAELIIFSTGASERDGVKEGEYTRMQAIELVERIAPAIRFDGFAPVLRQILEQISIADIESQNTKEELRLNFAHCISLGITQIILVSSPWHAPRCLLEASNVAAEMRAEGATVPDILFIPSHGSTQGTMVMEIPHRGDRQKHRGPEIGRKLHHALSRVADPTALEEAILRVIEGHYHPQA